MEANLKKLLKTLKINESAISTAFGALVVVVIGVMIFNYFKSFNRSKVTETAPVEVTQMPGTESPVIVEEDGKKIPQGLPSSYKVEKNDSLWKIAEKYYGSGYNWVDIAKENNLKSPDRLAVGMELKIPKAEVIEIKVVANGRIDAKGASKTLDSETYITVKGDHLWSVAVRAYGDGYAWTKIYQANKSLIGANPGNLAVGISLKLPR
jgi:nucleoid-associated protein YgaU